MKRSKLLAVAVLALSSFFMLSASALANVKHHRGAAMARMTKELNLTADQQAKIKPLVTSEHSQIQAVRKDTSLNADQRKARIKEIRQSTNSQIQSNLNADQQQKWTQMKQSHKNHKKA